PPCAPGPPGRPPSRARGPRAADLDGADDRPAAVDAPRTARAIEAIECEKLARHEAACRLRGKNFRPRRPHGNEQGCDHNRQPRFIPVPLPITAAAATVTPR